VAVVVNCGFVFWESFGNGVRLLYDPEEPNDGKNKVNMQLAFPTITLIYYT